MSRPYDQARRRIVLWLGGAAAISAVLGAASFARNGPAPRAAEAGALVTPGFKDRAKDVALLMVTTSEESYHIARDNNVWVMPEKGRYPVRPELIDRLTRALGAMRLDAAMTKDARKLDRIGLGDPAAGGTGALVEAGDGRGETFAKLIVGRRDGKSYVRRPNEPQGWSIADADPPPLHRAARWLDLDIVHVAPGDIAEVEVRPAAGPAYRLRPADETGARFALAAPFDGLKLAASFAPTPPALALARWSASDVAPAAALAALSPQPLGEHATLLKSGLAIRARLWRTRLGDWLTLEAKTPPGSPSGAAAEAQRINARAAPWAFGVSAADISTLTTPLSAIADVK